MFEEVDRYVLYPTFDIYQGAAVRAARKKKQAYNE